MARETSTSSRVNPRRSSIFPHRPLEDLHRAVERAEAEGPLGGGVPTPIVPKEDPRRSDPTAGEKTDLRRDIERAIHPLDEDPGHRQSGAEWQGMLLLCRVVRTNELVRPGGRKQDEPALPLLDEGKVVRRLGACRERAKYRVPVGLAQP